MIKKKRKENLREKKREKKITGDTRQRVSFLNRW